ncbi:MAG: inositol monophosphatase family protein [Deltaproteobacteria bacterium]
MTSDLNLQDVLNFLFEVADRAGQELMANFNRVECAVDPKDLLVGGIDVVTCADRASEESILSAIKTNFPEHDILSEEAGAKGKGSPWLWVVDPLDGTINFAHGFPLFSVSIALMKDGVPVLGMIHDPILKENFYALKGGGAHVNGRPVRVSWNDKLKESVVGTVFPHERAYSSATNVSEVSRVVMRAQGMREIGSPAVNLAYVACGRLDGCWGLKLKPYDLAAGVIIVEEAGGRISDRGGNPTDVYTDFLVATNGLIHDELIALLSDDSAESVP